MGATKRIVFLVVGLSICGAAAVGAQPRRGAVVVVPPIAAYRPYLYDPFWSPWYPYGYGYSYAGRPQASVRTEVTPKDTEVFVDGYYAGKADDFDGIFQRLHVAPGGHSITLHLDGFRTTTQNVFVRPDSTFTLKTAMGRLPAGEASAPVPAPDQPASHRRSQS